MLPPYELSAEQGDVVVLSPEVDLQSYSSQLAVQIPQHAAMPDSDLHRYQQQQQLHSPPSCPHPVEKNSGLLYPNTPSQERRSVRDHVWPSPFHLRSPQPQPPQPQQTRKHPKFAEIRPLMIQRKRHPPDVHLHRQPRLHAGEGYYDNPRPHSPLHTTYPHQSLRPGHVQNPRQAPPHVSGPVPVSIPMPPPLAAPLTRRRYPERRHGQGEVVVGCRYPDPRSYHTTRPLPPHQPQLQPQPHIDPYHRDHQPLPQVHPPSLRTSYQPSAQHPPSSSSAYSYPYPQSRSQSHPQYSSYSSTAARTTNKSRSRGASAPVIKLSVDGFSYEDEGQGQCQGDEHGDERGGGRGRGRVVPHDQEDGRYEHPSGGGGGSTTRYAVAGDRVRVGAGRPPQRDLQGQHQYWQLEHKQLRVYHGRQHLQHHPQQYQGRSATRPPPFIGNHQVEVSREPPHRAHGRPVPVSFTISQQPRQHPGMSMRSTRLSGSGSTARTGAQTAARTAWNPKGMPLAANGTREWSTDLCGFCDHNLGTCCKALWCPCIIYAQNKARIEHLYEKDAPMTEEMESCNEDCVIHGLLSSFSLCLFGWVIQIQNRTFIRRRHVISSDWLGDCCAALCCCSACELSQESREIELEERFRVRRRALNTR